MAVTQVRLHRGIDGNDVVKRLLVILLAVCGPALADEGAREWLDEMSSALQTLDYDGTFVYLHDDRLEAMRIIHRMDPGGQRERLVTLTGSAREVLRDDKAVTCIMPDNRSVMVGQSRPRQPFPIVPKDLDSVSPYYVFEDAGDDRMAGYNARVIAIKPRDAYRYGYRFWIDKNTRMLLKFDLNDVDGKPIEQVMFTRLVIGPDIPADDLQPSLTGDGYAWHRQEDIRRPAGNSTAGEPGWSVDRLPGGFRLTHFQHKRMREGRGDAEHMVFTDGLATVSVYVEKSPSGKPGFTGLSTMGAMNAYRIMQGDSQVTVVGEVPAATVEMIATSLVRNEAPARD
jgi:sigma-E factor negative regulatory protein RseB